MGRGATFTKPNTFSAGQTSDPAAVNSNFDAILNNLDPSGIGSYFANATEMQAASNPAPGGTPSIPTNLLGWVQQVQYQLAQLLGQTYWYQPPAAGKIEAYGGSAAPAGWLLCDGSAVSRTTYAALFTAISTGYGAGDGSTTFNVPDFRGRMLIGAGTGVWAKTFTASTSAGSLLLTVPSNQTFFTGTPFVPTSTGVLPTGLTSGVTYYAIYVSATTIKVATSLANAEAGTAIAYTDAGTGTHTATVTYSARSLGDTGGEEVHADLSAEMPAHTHVDSGHAHTGGMDTQQNLIAGGTLGTFVHFNTQPLPNTGVTAATLSNTGAGTAHNNMPPFGVVNWIIKT